MTPWHRLVLLFNVCDVYARVCVYVCVFMNDRFEKLHFDTSNLFIRQ